MDASSDVPGLCLKYDVGQDECTAELCIDRGKDSDDENKAIFDQLIRYRAEIKLSLGGSLSWDKLDAKSACRIEFPHEAGGYRSLEDEWPAL